VTYRRPQLLLDCLGSITEAASDLDEHTEILVVDNGSGDETADLVRNRFPEAQLLVVEENIGFTPAVMRGIQCARGEWIALFNDDVVVERGALRELLAAARSDDSIGSVAAQLRFASRPNLINSAGIEVDQLGVAADRLLGRSIDESEREPTEVFGVSGGAALYRARMLDEVGGFDESFFAYLEDVDVAWRARMCGWRAFYAPAAVAYHHHSATLIHGSPLKHFLVGRNRLRLLAKNATRRQLTRFAVRMFTYDIAYVAFIGYRQRTLAPLRGRLSGARDWRRYRRAGAGARRPVPLARPLGLRAALARNRAWPRPPNNVSGVSS
jgi:GT2 family glycosyltransferase